MTDKPKIDEFWLDDQVALVTGASSGIGQHMAYALAKAGAKVVLVGRDQERLSKTESSVRDDGGQASVVAIDLGDRDIIQDLYAQASRTFGAPTILVNAAGVYFVTTSLSQKLGILDLKFTTGILL